MGTLIRTLLKHFALLKTSAKILLLIYFAMLVVKVVDVVTRTGIDFSRISILLQQITPIVYDFLWFIVIFITVTLTINYLNIYLTETIKKENDIIIGLISSYGGRLTLGEVATKLKLTEDELERIIASINSQGEYILYIDKETKLISITSLSSLLRETTKEERLAKLEELYKEGKISEQTYRQLKEKYSKGEFL